MEELEYPSDAALMEADAEQEAATADERAFNAWYDAECDREYRETRAAEDNERDGLARPAFAPHSIRLIDYNQPHPF